MIELIIPGKPMGKQRPRVTRFGTHTPEKTVNYETLVQELYTVNKIPRLEGYIKMNIIAYYAIPKSTSKVKAKKMIDKEILPSVKPDVDNICKIICDSLNQLAYHDDNQIVNLSVSKFYSTEPRVVVQMEEIKADD